MLQVGDEHQPVVDPEVRNDVEHNDLGNGPFVCPVAEDREGAQEANVGSDDLAPVLRLEDDRVGVEVCGIQHQIVGTRCKGEEGRHTVGPLGVVQLAGSVTDQVQGPAEELLSNSVGECDDGRVAESFAHLHLAHLGNADVSVAAPPSRSSTLCRLQ